MSAKTVLSLIVWVGALSALADFSFSASAPLPKSTEEMLKKLKVEASSLANIDKELEVPKVWLDGARKEGKLRIYSTFDLPRLVGNQRLRTKLHPSSAVQQGQNISLELPAERCRALRGS